MVKQYILLLVILFCLKTDIISQFLYSTNADSSIIFENDLQINQDLINKYNPIRPLWSPVLESFGQNLLMGSFNFITGSEFA